MTDEELIARLRERAAEERDVQRNNEAVAAALMGQRLLFDQGIRSKANSFAVRLALEHENCAKNDAKLAYDWDAAADRIEALVKERDEAINQLDSARHSVDVLEKRVAHFMSRAERLEEAADYILDGMGIDAPDYEIDPDDDFLDAVNSDWVRDVLTRLAAALKGDDHA